MPEENKQDPKDIKEQIGKHLRAADELTRQQKFEEALMEIERALEIDPKHNYARSFLERVKLMYKRSQPKDSEQAVTEEKPPEDPAALISQYLAKAEEFIKNKDYTHALEEVAKVYKVDPKNYYAQTFSERIEILMNEKSSEEIKPVATLIQPELPEPQIQDKPEIGSRMMYMELLKEVWFDGKITEQEAQELKTIRELFGITQEEHLKLERETRIGAYLEALRIAWHDHSLSGLEQKALQMMIDKYGISKDEQIEAESRYADIQKSSKSRGTVLVVDSDRNILVSLSKQLQQRGLTVLLSQKVEDALQILRTHTPNLIISEILFPKDHIDGMGFRNKLSEDPALGQTPFIFISSIAHKKVVQACYRLGVDHVLEKPVDMKILFSIIDGKLRNSPQEK
ncbi:MAG: response regulator [Bacteroidetes bacterium]|nr:response regulator [Bacteroidota bacterium]